MSDNSQWYYVQAGAQHGPVGPDQIRALASSGAINRDTLVWSPALPGWLPLGQTELANLLGGPPPMSAPGFGAPAQGMPRPAAPAGAYGAPAYGAPAGAAYAAPGGGLGGTYMQSPGFVDAIKICFSKYVTWAGRATRSEFWFFYLFYLIVLVIASTIDVMFLGGTVGSDPTADGLNFNVNFTILTSIASLVLFLPMLSATVRRLHDTDRSGWWYWIILVPFVGVILLLVWFCSRSTPGPNRFG